MKPPICCICATDDDPKSGLVAFADHRPLPAGRVGHPHGLEWFCSRHLAAAQAFAHLPVEDALERVRSPGTWRDRLGRLLSQRPG